MPECHKCPHRAAVESGKYADAPFEKTPCGTCELVEDSTYTIQYDPERPADTGQYARTSGAKHPIPLKAEAEPDPSAPTPAEIAINAMQEFVTTLLTLRPRTRDIVCWRFQGMKYSEIADALGSTVAAVEVRHKRVLKALPILGELFPVTVAKRLHRKPHRKAGKPCNRMRKPG